MAQNGSPHTPPPAADSSSVSPPPARVATPSSSIKKVRQNLERLQSNGVVANDDLGQCLYAVVTRQEKEVFDLFLQERADPNGGGSALSPLYVAVDLGLTYYVEKLLEAGASVLCRNRDSVGDYPLRLAMEQGEGPIMDIFIKHISKLEDRAKDFPADYVAPVPTTPLSRDDAARQPRKKRKRTDNE